jgi:DNA-binding transcriptional LysR family regulator
MEVMMDSEALLSFLTVHRRAGFSAAAAQLGRSQPAISRRIALLEDRLGVALFDRGASGIALTPAGEMLLPFAERMMGLIADASMAMDAYREGQAGAVSIAIVGSLASTDLQQVLKGFRQRFAEVDLRLQTATSAEVTRAVRTGQAALGIRYFNPRAADLFGHHLYDEALFVVCSADHPLAGRQVAGLDDLAGERWLTFPRKAGQWEMSPQADFYRHLSDDRWMPVDSLTAQKRLVEMGFGIALLPQSAIVEECALGTLRIIDVTGFRMSNPVVLVTRRDGYLSPAAVTLRDALVAAHQG